MNKFKLVLFITFLLVLISTISLLYNFYFVDDFEVNLDLNKDYDNPMLIEENSDNLYSLLLFANNIGSLKVVQEEKKLIFLTTSREEVYDIISKRYSVSPNKVRLFTRYSVFVGENELRINLKVNENNLSISYFNSTVNDSFYIEDKSYNKLILELKSRFSTLSEDKILSILRIEYDDPTIEQYEISLIENEINTTGILRKVIYRDLDNQGIYENQSEVIDRLYARASNKTNFTIDELTENERITYLD